MANNDDNNQDQPEKKDVVVWNVRYPDFPNIEWVNEWKAKEIPLHDLLKAVVKECTGKDKACCYISRLYHYKQTGYKKNLKRNYDYWDSMLSRRIDSIEQKYRGQHKDLEERTKRDVETVKVFYQNLAEFCEHPILWRWRRLIRKIKRIWKNSRFIR